MEISAARTRINIFEISRSDYRNRISNLHTKIHKTIDLKFQYVDKRNLDKLYLIYETFIIYNRDK